MGSLSLAMQDKRITEAIRAFPSGEFGSLQFNQAVAKFVLLAMKDPQVAGPAKSAGLDSEDLCLVYASMVAALMPNPYIKSGGNMLAATLLFIEPFRLEPLFSAISRATATTTSTDRRRAQIADESSAVARVIWESHTQSRGEAVPPSPRSGSSGCGAAVILICGGAAVAFHAGHLIAGLG